MDSIHALTFNVLCFTYFHQKPRLQRGFLWDSSMLDKDYNKTESQGEQKDGQSRPNGTWRYSITFLVSLFSM